MCDLPILERPHLHKNSLRLPKGAMGAHGCTITAGWRLSTNTASAPDSHRLVTKSTCSETSFSSYLSCIEFSLHYTAILWAMQVHNNSYGKWFGKVTEKPWSTPRRSKRKGWSWEQLWYSWRIVSSKIEKVPWAYRFLFAGKVIHVSKRTVNCEWVN